MSWTRRVTCPYCESDNESHISHQHKLIALLTSIAHISSLGKLVYHNVLEKQCKRCQKTFILLTKKDGRTEIMCPRCNEKKWVELPDNQTLVGVFNKEEEIPENLNYDGFFSRKCSSGLVSHKFIYLTKIVESREGGENISNSNFSVDV